MAAHRSWVEARAARHSSYEVAKEQRNQSQQIRGLRQQVSNAITMLLNAGFKLRKSRDWNDDMNQTSAREESPYDTQLDMRKPGDEP
jgi:hypothetical protein